MVLIANAGLEGLKPFGSPYSLIIPHAIVCKCYGLLYNLTDNIDDISNGNCSHGKAACLFRLAVMDSWPRQRLSFVTIFVRIQLSACPR